MSRTLTEEEKAEQKDLLDLQQEVESLKAFAAAYLSFMKQLKTLVEGDAYTSDTELPAVVKAFRVQLGLKSLNADLFDITKSEYENVISELNMLEDTCGQIATKVGTHYSIVWSGQIGASDPSAYQDFKRMTSDPKTLTLKSDLVSQLQIIQVKLLNNQFKPASIAEGFEQTVQQHQPSLLMLGLNWLSRKLPRWLLPEPLFAREIKSYNSFIGFRERRFDDNLAISDLVEWNKLIREDGKVCRPHQKDSATESAVENVEPNLIGSSSNGEAKNRPSIGSLGHRLARRHSTGTDSDILAYIGVFSTGSEHLGLGPTDNELLKPAPAPKPTSRSKSKELRL